MSDAARILGVDDENQLRRLLHITLEAGGYKISVAESGEDGLRQAAVFRSGPLSVDLSARVVKKNGEIVRLTPTEYSLVALFVLNAGKVLTHRYILQQIY